MWIVCVWDGGEGVSLCLCVGGRCVREICQFLEPGKHTVEVGGEGVSFLKKWMLFPQEWQIQGNQTRYKGQIKLDTGESTNGLKL